jgi:hypothetical protein
VTAGGHFDVVSDIQWDKGEGHYLVSLRSLNRGTIRVKFPMTGQEKGDLFIQVTA